MLKKFMVFCGHKANIPVVGIYAKDWQEASRILTDDVGFPYGPCAIQELEPESIWDRIKRQDAAKAALQA